MVNYITIKDLNQINKIKREGLTEATDKVTTSLSKKQEVSKNIDNLAIFLDTFLYILYFL